MNGELVLNPATAAAVAVFAASPGHTLLITGPMGSGKGSLARKLAAEVLNIKSPKLSNYSYFITLEPDMTGSHSIDSIRNLQAMLKLKTIGKRSIRRVALLEQAEALTIEAQNALLKLLEEPPADTLLLLTTTDSTALLPTIRSRVQQIAVIPPSEKALTDFFLRRGHSQSDVKQAYLLSEGRVGLMHAVLDKDQTDTLSQAVTSVKQLLSGSSFERLQMVEQLSKDKLALQQLIDALILTSRAGLFQSLQSGQVAGPKRWLNLYQTALVSRQKLARNAQTKLLLDDLLLTI